MLVWAVEAEAVAESCSVAEVGAEAVSAALLHLFQSVRNTSPSILFFDLRMKQSCRP